MEPSDVARTVAKDKPQRSKGDTIQIDGRKYIVTRVSKYTMTIEMVQ
jgi:hypothetical protein